MVKQVIVVRKDLNMRKGKIAAQVAHASLGIFFDRMQETSSHGGASIYSIKLDKAMTEWKRGAFTKIVVACEDENALLAMHAVADMRGLPTKMIIDAGHTEFHGVPTRTCLAIGPAEESELDAITGHLKLM